jgi:hypothetical protein
MTESETREARKAWRERNSDGRNAWPAGTQTQAPPGFTEDEEPMPDPASGRINEAARTESGEAVVHRHVYSVEDPDA